jgi:hypothetical protein
MKKYMLTAAILAISTASIPVSAGSLAEAFEVSNEDFVLQSIEIEGHVIVQSPGSFLCHGRSKEDGGYWVESYDGLSDEAKAAVQSDFLRTHEGECEEGLARYVEEPTENTTIVCQNKNLGVTLSIPYSRKLSDERKQKEIEIIKKGFPGYTCE